MKYIVIAFLLFGCRTPDRKPRLIGGTTEDDLRKIHAALDSNGDVGDIYIQDKRIRDSISDDAKIHRYADSVFRYLQIKFSAPDKSELYWSADKQYRFYEDLLIKLSNKWPTPETPIEKPKDVTIYPLKP